MSKKFLICTICCFLKLTSSISQGDSTTVKSYPFLFFDTYNKAYNMRLVNQNFLSNISKKESHLDRVGRFNTICFLLRSRTGNANIRNWERWTITTQNPWMWFISTKGGIMRSVVHFSNRLK
jgi:hypothetical protein